MLDRSELDEIYVHGDVVAVTFAVMELYNAILFNADPKVLDEMARNALCYREGWSGVVADFNVKWILSCYCLITDRADTDSTVLDDAHQAFASFPQSELRLVSFQVCRTDIANNTTLQTEISRPCDQLYLGCRGCGTFGKENATGQMSSTWWNHRSGCSRHRTAIWQQVSTSH